MLFGSSGGDLPGGDTAIVQAIKDRDRLLAFGAAELVEQDFFIGRLRIAETGYFDLGYAYGKKIDTGPQAHDAYFYYGLAARLGDQASSVERDRVAQELSQKQIEQAKANIKLAFEKIARTEWFLMNKRHLFPVP